MAKHIKVPIKKVNGVDWGDLNALCLTHEFVGETVSPRPDLSFQGGHRVRHYKFKKNVHWLIPVGITLDIASVEQPARKQQGNRR